MKKLFVMGIDGLDPRLTKKLIADGRMPNLEKFIKNGSAREDLAMIGGQPTVTPPMWTTLATGANPSTHGITEYWRKSEDLETVEYNFDSANCKAEPLWNVTANAGLKTLVWHWPGSSWPPTSDSENLYVVDGTQPGGPNIGTAEVESELLLIANNKTETVSFHHKAATDSEVPCYISGMDVESNTEASAYDRVHSKSVSRVAISREETELALSETPFDIVFSPIKNAQGWSINPEEHDLECTLLLSKGLIRRPCLIRKNRTSGEYNSLMIFKTKKSETPIVQLKLDEYVSDVIDEAILDDKHIIVNRNMRLLEMAPDGSSLRLWVSSAMDFNNDIVWHPKSLLKDIVDNVGYPQPICLAGGSDERLISKCMRATWDQAGKWNSNCIKYLAKEKEFDVIFSHFHNVDMQGHMLVKYLKNGSKLSAEKCQELFEAVYEQTDEYIGYFTDMLNDDWNIIILSDHGQVCPEHTPAFGITGGTGITAIDMVDLGYTVLKKDNDGTPLHEIDWEHTTAVCNRVNEIYINLKGREKHGIVEPSDKYELEERIMTDLYGLRDKETGHRIISLALRNKDALLLGTGGPECGDIIFYIAEGYTQDHADSISTTYGVFNTSVSSIFVASGPNFKKNFTTSRVIKHIDVAPTIASILNVEMPAQSEGAILHQIIQKN